MHAGTGAVSLALLACGCVRKALITDIPDLLPHIQHNLQRNAPLFDPRRAAVLVSYPAYRPVLVLSV